MILIVDDRHENIIALRKLLESHHFQVDEALSGEEALRKILVTSYSLIILDVQMPGMDGFEVAEAILGYSKTRETPIIFLSAVSVEKKFVTKGYQSGGLDYITKPVDPDIFILKVATFTRLYQQKIELTQTQLSLRAEIESRKLAETKKDDFISIASHELKTPLTSMKGYLQLLESSSAEGNLATTGKYIKRTLLQLDKLNSLVADLLDTSKIESGKLQFCKKEHDFDELVSNAIDIVRQTHPRHFILEEGKTDERVFADDVRLEQVIINYLTNAIKYSPEASEIKVKKSLEAGLLRFSVSDSGIGIPENKLTHIFEKFFRVEENFNQFQGLGMGLYISAEIIKRHDGRYGVKSVLGEGSTFYFELPLATKE